jgi:CheY-like chemotaxis protein
VAEESGGPDHVRIRVRDTGIGIAPELRDKVFDMFMQGDQSLERTRGGLGVGLTLVRNLVALHGGRVDVWSEGVGRGSELTVSLPIESAPVRASDPNEGAAPVHVTRPLRILVADDNEDGREMLHYLLTKEGHTVVQAEDGERALAAVAALDPDVAILDIGMPGLNGYELARALRPTAEDRRPFLVALSGLGQAEDKARAAAAGFDQHFTKPVDIGALLSLIAERAQ